MQSPKFVFIWSINEQLSTLENVFDVKIFIWMSKLFSENKTG